MPRSASNLPVNQKFSERVDEDEDWIWKNFSETVSNDGGKGGRGGVIL